MLAAQLVKVARIRSKGERTLNRECHRPACADARCEKRFATSRSNRDRPGDTAFAAQCAAPHFYVSCPGAGAGAIIYFELAAVNGRFTYLSAGASESESAAADLAE